MSDCYLLHQDEGVCGWCGKTLTGRRTKWCSKKCSRHFVASHRWTQAKAEAKKRRQAFQCEHCEGYFKEVEVNHIEPCLGKHGVWGCHHHQNNLEVLCPPCHRIQTNRQRSEGAW